MAETFRFLAFFALLVAASAVHAQPVVGHVLDVVLSPERGTLAVRDTLSLPVGEGPWTFSLHRGLDPQVAEGDAELTPVASRDHLEIFRLQVRTPGPVTLRYAGGIRGGLETVREGMGRSRQWSRGTIGEDGIVLNGYSGWYPQFTDALHRFALDVGLPPGWTAVSQGDGPLLSETPDGVRTTWREDQPQDDIYLIAAPFTRYARPTPFGEAQVYLRAPDEPLAERYLEATAHYLRFYSELIGPYPYAKFALVENFWETGYGMPSFTLLGPGVIRLPFIIHTSYPHEVLHNWWGNGVYVDYGTGNWSEGLTAYLADHLLKEQRGQGADYRRDSLKSYADYVSDGDDFPIHAFRGRHGSASQAVGYGKTLMVLHMLRRDLGDPVFVESLRRFYRDNRFRTAGFDELRHAFEGESGRDLADFFEQWTSRSGAPELALSDVAVEPTGDGYRLRGRIEQIQDGAPFPLTVPLVLHLEDGDVLEQRIALNGSRGDFAFDLAARPLRLTLDPGFDLFRRLVPGETPVTLSALFGADRGLIVLPDGAPAALAAGYRRLAASWTQGSTGWEVVQDGGLDTLPADRPVWLLGWENRFVSVVSGTGNRFGLDPGLRRFETGGQAFVGEAHSIALVRENQGKPLGFAAGGDPEALPGLARKLPHYGKYSYLAFEGKTPTNRFKGQWPAQDSRLTVWLSDARPVLELPPQTPLAAAAAEVAAPAGAERR